MTRSQVTAARTAAACFGLLALGLLALLLCSLGGCGGGLPGEDPGAVEARVIVDRDTGSDCPGVAPASFKAHLRALLLGDSITAGNLAQSSWRAPLLAALNVRPEIQTVEFVGSMHPTPAGGNAGPLPCCHEGHPGISIPTAAGYVPTWMAAASPDVVLTLLGANGGTVEQYVAGIVDATLAAAPSATVIAAPITGMWPDNSGVVAFNAALVTALHAHPAYGSRLLVADDMADVLAAGDDYLQTTGQNDGVHPGPTGNAKIAAVWRAAGAGRVWAGGSP